MARYVVRKVHATALQKRLYPEARDKPYVVQDSLCNQLVGLPDRYRNRSGAQDRADRLNAQEAEHEHVFDAYNDAGYGIVHRCDCGVLDPAHYSHAERGYPEDGEDDS